MIKGNLVGNKRVRIFFSQDQNVAMWARVGKDKSYIFLSNY